MCPSSSATQNRPVGNFLRQLIRRHVGFMPAIGRYHPAVSKRRGVDDRQHRRRICFTALANQDHRLLKDLGALWPRRALRKLDDVASGSKAVIDRSQGSSCGGA